MPFPVFRRGSFAVRDHLRSNSGIIFGAVQISQKRIHFCFQKLLTLLKFQQLLKTRVTLILSFTRPHAITYTNILSLKSDFAPKARQANTKASFNTNSNSVRDMFMTFNGSAKSNELEILLPNTRSALQASLASSSLL